MDNGKKVADQNIEMIRFAMEQVYGADAAKSATDYLLGEFRKSRESAERVKILNAKANRWKKRAEELRIKLKEGKKLRKSLSHIIDASRALGRGELRLSDGTSLIVGETYYGGDGRAWKLLFPQSEKWLDVDGFDLNGVPVELQVKREWLTVEPPDQPLEKSVGCSSEMPERQADAGKAKTDE